MYLHYQKSYDKTLILVLGATIITALLNTCILACNKSAQNLFVCFREKKNIKLSCIYTVWDTHQLNLIIRYIKYA